MHGRFVFMTAEKKDHMISEEVLIIKHSGEIPEVAYHNTIYHLTEDPEGPAIQLTEEDLYPLKQAVVERYQWIILRDMNPQNRDKRIYRGLERSATNWKRLKAFCEKEGIRVDSFRGKAALALKNFLLQELEDVQTGKRRKSSINCSFSTLLELATDLGLASEDIPKEIEVLCGGPTD